MPGWVVQTVEPPLQIRSVSLPREAISQANGVTFFGLDVRLETGEGPWRVSKRYNEFRSLASNLGLLAQFPRKHMLGCAGDRLEKRREKLEAWLKTALQYQQTYPGMRPLLHDFLQVQLAPRQGATGGPSLVTLQIEIPAGVQAGQAILVTVPDDRQAVITVPAGYAGGMTLLFDFNSENGALTMLA